MVTRLFSRMFDAVQADEDELLKQVQSDLNTAAKEGKVDTEQLSYESNPKEGVINVVDKGNNETTSFVPKDDGFLMKSDDQSYLIPKLTDAIVKLNEKIDNLNTPENKSTGEDVVAPSSAENSNEKEGKNGETEQDKPDKPTKEEKSESAAHPDQKVIIPIDGEFKVGYIIEEIQGGKVKVKVPSMGIFVNVNKDSISSLSPISENNRETHQKRTVDEYRTFSRSFNPRVRNRRFSVKSVSRKFSTGEYGIYVDLGNSKMEPYIKKVDSEDTGSVKLLRGGFKSFEEASEVLNSNRGVLIDELKKLNKRNFVANQ